MYGCTERLHQANRIHRQDLQLAYVEASDDECPKLLEKKRLHQSPVICRVKDRHGLTIIQSMLARR